MFGRKQTQIKGHIIQNSFFAKWFEFLKILGIKKWESGRLLLITSGRRVLGEWGRWSLGFGSIKDNNKCRESTPMLISPIVFPASEVLPPPPFFFLNRCYKLCTILNFIFSCALSIHDAKDL